MVVSYGNSVTYLQYPVNTTYNIRCGRFSFVFEVLRCFALSYVPNPEGTFDLSKWKKKVGFWDVFISKTSDVKVCLSVQSIFQSLCFSLTDLYLQYPHHTQKLDSLAPNRPKNLKVIWCIDGRTIHKLNKKILDKAGFCGIQYLHLK